MSVFEEIDCPRPLADWLRAHNAVAPEELTALTAEHAANNWEKQGPELLRLSPAAAARLRNGTMMLAVLRSLYAKAGATCPTAALAQLDDVGTRHLNWAKVMDTLKAAYAVDVWDADSDRKALIVGGSSVALVTLLDSVRSRTGEEYRTLRSTALARQAAIDAAVAQGGCTGRAVRTKLWVQALDHDSFMLFILLIQQGMGIYACVISSLLAVFVPQLCPDPEPHVCTLHDNFHDLIPFNKAVVGINFITLFYYLFVQSVLAGREYWCIDRFDEEPTLRVDNLLEELKLYPRLRATLHRLNNIAATLAVSLLVLVLGNLAISAGLILNYYSAGKTSVTGLISSVLLVMPRLIFWVTHSVGSARTGLPKQLFQRRPMLSNTVDKDWRFDPAIYVPNLHGTSASPAAALGDVPLAPRPRDLEAPPASVEDAPASS